MADSTKFFVMRGDKVLFESMTKEEIYSAIVQAIEQGEIGDIDTGFVTKIKEQNHNNDLKFWKGTQAEYNALEAVDPTTYYILTDAPGHTHLIFENDLQITGKLTVDDKIQANNRINAAENVVVEGDITGRRGITAQGQLLASDNARFDKKAVFQGDIDIISRNNGVYKISNFALTKYISASFDEMIWQPIELETGITAHARGGYSKPMFRKVGDRVDIIGAVEVTWAGSGQILVGTLPDGFRPKNNSVYALVSMSGDTIARIFVNTSGEIRIEFMRNISDGSAVTTADTWVQLNMSFYILNTYNVNDNS